MLSRIRDRLERWANPMLVRQMYQSLHNRKFLASMWFLVLAALGAYVLIFSGSGAGSPPGGTMFLVFGGLLYLVAMLVSPFLAFTSLQKEIKTGTIELIEITPMSARCRIRGRLQAIFSRVLLLYCVIGPFAVAAYLLGGVSLGDILVRLYTLLVASCVIGSVALFCASLALIKYVGSVARGVFFLLLVGMFVSGLPRIFPGAGMLLMEMGGAGWRAILAYIIILTLEGGLFAWFLCAASANVLTFPANKSSGRIKFIMLLLVLSSLISFGISRFLAYGGAGGLTAIERWGAAVLGGVAIFWMTGRRRLAVHTAEKLKDRSGWYRAIFYPFVDGAGSTTIFLFLSLLMLETGIIMWYIFTGLSPQGKVAGYFPMLALVYAPYFSSCAWIVGRCLPLKYRNAAVRRVTVFGLIWAHLIIGGILSASCGRMTGHVAHPLIGLFPFAFISIEMHSGAGAMQRMWGLSLAILVGLLPHAYIGVRDLVEFCRISDLRRQYHDMKRGR